MCMLTKVRTRRVHAESLTTQSYGFQWFDLPLIAEIVDNRIGAAVRHGQPIENQVQSPRSKRLCVWYNHKQIR